MLRKIIAIALVVTVLFVSTPKPAYANSDYFGFAPQYPVISETLTVNSKNTLNKGFIWENMAKAYESSDFLQGVVKGALGTVGTAAGGALVCYGISGVVAPVFPPAAALIPFCPDFSLVSGGGNILKEGWQIITP
ncbi:MAG: hypothetical protein SAJ12_22920 [Jaaginema sp. PMC 1079.18]|nr:hypothetical protein [Jaaginema sp. PMC 1080.18]MEC4853843.1 hypothetical protein [Jaaginema sp. PMC 1079.18]MEC4865128.1 hypothetical protein [Jaaginema sp. PMC 1078.18]